MTFEEVYKYRKVAYRVANGFLGASEADDVVQIVFAHVNKHLNKLNSKNVINYIRAATKNTCLNILRDKQRRLARHIKKARPERQEAETRVTDLMDSLTSGIARLTPKQQETLILASKGYTAKEIAEICKITEERAHNRMQEARKALKLRFMKNPRLTVSKGRVLANRKPIRGLTPEALEDNFIVVGPFGPQAEFYGHDRTTCVMYCLQDEADRETVVEEIKAQNAPIFHQYLPMSIRFASGGSLGLFWKHKVAKYLAGAVQYHFETWQTVEGEKKVLVLTHMAVKPRYRKNRLNSLVIEYIVKNSQHDLVVFHEPTKDGWAFMKAYGGEDYMDAVRRLGAK